MFFKVDARVTPLSSEVMEQPARTGSSMLPLYYMDLLVCEIQIFLSDQSKTT